MRPTYSYRDQQVPLRDMWSNQQAKEPSFLESSTGAIHTPSNQPVMHLYEVTAVEMWMGLPVLWLFCLRVVASHGLLPSRRQVIQAL
jgi:hypothetical protein